MAVTPPVCVLIPAYNPDEHLLRVVQGLVAAGFTHILVVNDGSTEACLPVFQAVAAFAGVTLVTHAVNQGKGAALKTGMHYIQDHYPDALGVITADADGQHTIDDIQKVEKTFRENPKDIILGVRAFGESVPWRSKFGNTLTQWLFRKIYKKKITDTQTGLRAIPVSLFPALLVLASTRYEYEMECLIRAVKLGVQIQQVPIQTVYIDHNAASHFNPLVDSIRIYWVFLRYLVIAVLSFLIDTSVYWIGYSMSHTIFSSLLVARIFSGTFNFYFNKYVVYRNFSKEKLWGQIMRYVGLAGIVFIFNYYLIQFWMWLGLDHAVVAKVLSDAILFIISFFTQKLYIFNKHKPAG